MKTKARRHLNLKLKRRISTSWAKLPLPALAEVLRYLSDSERVACAQVCCHWKHAFESPMLWRERAFEFGGSRFRPLGQKAVLYAEKFGRHLRHVTITCHQLTSHTCESMVRCLGQFLGALNSQTKGSPPALCQLEILGLELEFWRYGNLRDQVAACLVSFLAGQHSLKTFCMSNAQFGQEAGVMMLDTLSAENGTGLESLVIEFFFQSRTMVLDNNRFQQAMERFTNLRSVCLNYCCLSEGLVKCWADSLCGKLKYLRIRCSDSEPCDHVITNGAWSKLTSACAGLTVDLYIFGFGRSSKVLPLLSPQMPLATLSFLTGYDIGIELGLTEILNHVIFCYNKTLNNLDLEFDNFHDNVDDAILKIVSRCRNLLSLRVKAQTNLEVARCVCRMLEEGRTTLRQVEFMLCDVTPMEMEQLRDLRDVMTPVVQGRGVELILRDDLFSP